MSKTKTPSQLETAKVKAENKKNTTVYLDPLKTAEFCNWLKRKEKYKKIEFNDYEVSILSSLDRIKKVKREGMFRIYQFIQNLQAGNHSFYMIFEGRGQIKIMKTIELYQKN